jgi:ankyrin repeat protein
MQRLLEAGADPMTLDGLGETALHVAVSTGSVPVVEVILGAIEWTRKAIDVSNDKGWTPLHLACHVGCDIVRVLVAAGADLSAKDTSWFTPLHIACQRADH